MDSSEEKKCLEKLQEFVEDEDKIVTVSLLALTLEISVQDGLKLLEKYVENQKKSHSDKLTVTYVITGTLKDGPGNTVCLVKESEVEKKKKSLQNVTSQVIYSIQKASNVDFNVVALVDWPTDDLKPLPGTVCSKNCTRRTIKVKVLPSPPKPVLKGKSSYFMPKTEKPAEKPTETSTKPKPAGGVADLFNKATTSSKAKPEQKINTSKPNNASKSQGKLSAFFSKSSSSSSSVKTEEKINTDMSERGSSIKESEITDDDFAGFMEVDLDEDKEEVEKETKKETKKVKKAEEAEKVKKAEETEKVKKAENTKSSTKKNKKESSKRKRDVSEDKDIKKRKRIIQFNDSDSDDIFEKEEEDIIEISEPEQERIPTPPPRKILPPKNKKRKSVENTFMDDEGFIVTQTDHIFESASEDENEEPPKPPPKKQEEVKKENGITKKSSNSSEGENSPKTVAKKGGKKGKKNNMQNQPTLMNFFKKK